jgi:hypothetical protein
LIAADDASTLSKVPPPSSFNSGMNVSKATVDAAELAGKSKFSAGEAGSLANFVNTVVASSNQSAALGLLKGTSSYWQSSGPTGSHYLDIEMKSGVLASTVGLVVDTTDESYCPAELTVAVAKDKESLSKSPVHSVAHNFSTVIPGRKFMFALLDNEDPSVRFVRIGIQRCISGGQDTRVRGIIVRGSCGAAEIKMTNPSTDADSCILFGSLDVSLVWIQSITEGILHDLHNEGSCNFTNCNQEGVGMKEVAARVRHVFNRALQMSSKYVGPQSSQEDIKVRNVRYLCSRNAMLRIVPEALKNCWRQNFDISKCLTAATSGLCASAMLSPLANLTDKTCQNDFESLILFADCIAPEFSSEKIRSTILHTVQGFIGENLLRAALLQHALRTCASYLWGTKTFMDLSLAASSMPKLSPPVSKPIDSKSQLLVPWRGSDSRNTLSTLPLSVKFHDFSTLKGCEFRRYEKHGYFEIEVIKELQYPQVGFCTSAFKKLPFETKNGCGDDADSWYDLALQVFCHLPFSDSTQRTIQNIYMKF